jgi:C-terminal peptidase prc
VVIIKQNDPKKNEILMTRRWSKSNTSIPVIILINDYSASASEIFAWAMKDHDRAILLGDRSYGKWSVQEPFDLGDGSIVKITTARWYTPKDTSIDEKWITPDVIVILSNKDYENIFDRQLKSAQSIIQDQIDNWLSVVATRDKYKINTFSSLTGTIIK